METLSDSKLYQRSQRRSGLLLQYFAAVVTLLLIGQTCFIGWLWATDKISITTCNSKVEFPQKEEVVKRSLSLQDISVGTPIRECCACKETHIPTGIGGGRCGISCRTVCGSMWR